VVIGETNEQTKSVFLQKAQQEAAPVFFADQHYKLENAHLVDDLYMQYQVEQDSQPLMEALLSDLLGSYQQKNLVTALKTIEILREKGFAIQESHLRNGLQQVTRNTGFKGRWFVLQRNPWVICDTAHNREGLSYIMQQLQELHVPHIHFVLGFVNDKNLDNVLDLFPTSGSYYFTKADIPRALDEKQLAAKAGEYYLKGTTHPTVAKALEAAMANAGIEDLIYLGGSTFVVSEII
jgi:dihydrofolate synthase/folylpolyglutamate synthase